MFWVYLFSVYTFGLPEGHVVCLISFKSKYPSNLPNENTFGRLKTASELSLARSGG